MNVRLEPSLDRGSLPVEPTAIAGSNQAELLEPSLEPSAEAAPELELDLVLSLANGAAARDSETRGPERGQLLIAQLAASAPNATRNEGVGLEPSPLESDDSADTTNTAARDVGPEFYTTPEDFWAEVVGLHEQLVHHPQLAPRAVENAIAWVAAGFRLAAVPAPNGAANAAPSERLREFTVSLSDQATRALLVAHEQRGSALRAAGGGKG